MVKVPIKTTVYNKDPLTDDYTFGFAPELIPLILDGDKFKTYRFKDKKYENLYNVLKKGDVVNFQNSTTKEIKGKVKLVSKELITFGDLPLNIFGHEAYEDKDHQRKVFSGYYGYLERPIDDNDNFVVFEFELI